MRFRKDGIGGFPKLAPMLSVMWRTLAVAGITQVTAGCETTNFRYVESYASDL